MRMTPLRRGLRRAGAGDALARAARHLLPDAVRRALPRPCSGRSATSSTRPTAGAQRLLIFAAINLLVCLPLHWFGLARRETERHAGTARMSQPVRGAGGRRRSKARPAPSPWCCSALIVAASAVVFGAMAVHLVPILEATGLVGGAAVSIASLKGVAQVAGRIWDLTLARKWHPIDVGRVSVALHAALVPRADARRRQLLAGARLHAAVRHLQRPRHHHARRGSAGPVRRQGLRRGAGHSGNALSAAGGRRAGRLRPRRRALRLLRRPRPSCWAPGLFRSSAWR